MDSGTDNEQLIRRFCEAFPRRDIDEIVGFFAEGAVYHNIPMAPAVGVDAIRSVLELFVPGSSNIEFEILGMASSGPLVFTERVDRFALGDRNVELPVAGVFEVADGKITAWRDYFDMQMFTGAG